MTQAQVEEEELPTPTGAEATIDDETFKLLEAPIRDYFFTDLKHKELTPVQKCTTKNMLDSFDCIVRAPTGSGKSLAYVLPVMQIVVNKKHLKEKECASADKDKDKECQVLALVVVPNRELVNQLNALFKPVCRRLNITLIRLYGSGGASKKRIKIGIKHFKGPCILIATPGRVESFLAKEPQLKSYLKHLEVLVIDEADRYSDQESRRSLSTLLSVLPKQRRTALFSATQATGVEEDLRRFGLRNPLRVTVGADGAVDVRKEDLLAFAVGISTGQNGAEGTAEQRMPNELKNYYACVPAECKLLAMLKFLKSQKSAKVLAFVSNAAQAEYFALIVPPLLADPDRTVLSLHRKMEQKRQKILDRFRTTDRAILFATDLLARGVDVADIDWVLQFDLPKLSRLFVHRSGRAGRMGRAGRSLLLLTREEEAYVQFLQRHERVELEESGFGALSEQKAEQIRLKVQEMAIADRKILELGSSAFVCFIEAYNRHDCQIVCRIKELNIAGLANAFALLRMPQIRELKARKNLDLEAFQPRMDVKTSQIPFRDAKLETKRQAMLSQRKMGGGGGETGKMKKNFNGQPIGKKVKFEEAEEEENEGKKNGLEDHEEEEDEDESQGKMMMKKQERGGGGSGKKRRKPMSDWEQLQRGGQLLKKFKKGRMSKQRLDEQLDEL